MSTWLHSVGLELVGEPGGVLRVAKGERASVEHVNHVIRDARALRAGVFVRAHGSIPLIAVSASRFNLSPDDFPVPHGYCSAPRHNIPTRDRTFGFAPPDRVRHGPACRVAGIHGDIKDNPTAQRLIANTAKIAKAYETLNPLAYARHAAWVAANIAPSWTIAPTPFTSGVVNKANALPYHQDHNVRGLWSAMLVKHDGLVWGGELVLPELDLALSLPHGTLILFDGSQLLHGVSPISGPGTRYSIVWYTRTGMDKCLCDYHK